MKPTASLLSTMALCLLMACQRQTPMPEAALRAPVARPSADLVEELARDPERLKAMRRQCRENRPGRDEALCIASRSEEHTSELQSLMRISYAVFCLKKKTKPHN